MTAKSGNTLTVERGFQGRLRAWPAGTRIARAYTAYDHEAFRGNIADLSGKYDSLPAAAKSGSFNDLSDKPVPDITVVLAADSAGTGAYKSVGTVTTGTPYQHNRVYLAMFDRVNTGAASLNLNSLGAKSLLRDGQAIRKGELLSTTYYLLVYDTNSGGRFHIISQGAALSPHVASSPLPGYALGTAAAVSASDSIVGAFGKLQAQVNALGSGSDGGGGGVKGFQKGILGMLSATSTFTTISITPVVCEKSVIVCYANFLSKVSGQNYYAYMSNANFQGYLPGISAAGMTSGTIVLSWAYPVINGGTPSTHTTAQLNWAVIEFE
jgi:hypothetical protein